MRRPTGTEAVTAAIGAALGATAARIGPIFDWIRSADWSSLPATIVGTSVPAAAGFFFARSLARNSVRTLERDRLDETHLHEERLRAEALDAAERRAACWQRVLVATQRVSPPRFTEATTPLADRVTMLVTDRLQAELTAWTAAGESGPKPKRSAPTMAASSLLDVPNRLRSDGPDLVRCLDELVETFGVHAMHVPLRATRKLVQLAADVGRWPPVDPAAFLDAMGGPERPYLDQLMEVTDQAWRAFQQLALLANEYRARPHAADDVDPIVDWSDITRRGGEVAAVPATFAKLEDLIGKL